jgi:hypothetical protein
METVDAIAVPHHLGASAGKAVELLLNRLNPLLDQSGGHLRKHRLRRRADRLGALDDRTEVKFRERLAEGGADFEPTRTGRFDEVGFYIRSLAERKRDKYINGYRGFIE